jgi:hypothetical protein
MIYAVIVGYLVGIRLYTRMLHMRYTLADTLCVTPIRLRSAWRGVYVRGIQFSKPERWTIQPTGKPALAVPNPKTPINRCFRCLFSPGIGENSPIWTIKVGRFGAASRL